MSAPFRQPWKKVIEWVLENFNEPVWADCTGLDNTFNMVSDGSRKDKLTFEFLISKQAHDPTKNQAPNMLSTDRFENWYKYNKDYLPTEMRDLNLSHDNYIRIRENDKAAWELIRKFNEWYFSMMNKVELDMCQRYFNGGARRHLDILERRFRSNWGQQKETTVETKKETDSESIVIKFTEA